MVPVLEKGEQHLSQLSREHHVTRSLWSVWWQLYQERGEATFQPTAEVFSGNAEVRGGLSPPLSNLRGAHVRLLTFLEDVYNAKHLSPLVFERRASDEVELKCSMCSRLSGLEFLGVFQMLSCQFGCQQTVYCQLTAGRTALEGERGKRERAGRAIETL